MSDRRNRPRPSQPLDRSERTALAELGREIERADPSLAAALTERPAVPRPPDKPTVSGSPARRGFLEILLVVLGTALLLGVAVVAEQLWGAVGIAVMAASLVVTVIVLALLGIPRPSRR